MPYITRDRRLTYDSALLSIAEKNPTWGDINYCITTMILHKLARECATQPNFSEYDRRQAAIGVLECAKLELYNRKVTPYERAKRFENGDVY